MNKKILLPILMLVVVILACARMPKIPGQVDPGETDPTPVERITAKEAIQTYALDVLGLEIPRLLAGGATGELSLPISMQGNVDLAIDLAGKTYFGIWSGGIASLSSGDSDIGGDFIADIRDGSLGVFAINVETPPPTDPAAALDLILETFPRLQGYQWIESPSDNGFGFTTGEAERVTVQTWAVELEGTTIHAGVAPGVIENQSFVWAVVASGVLAAPFKK